MDHEKAEVPQWIEKRYGLLWNRFNNSPFRLEEASEYLTKANKDHEQDVPVILSELRKAGLLKVEMDLTDARKRIYSLLGTGSIVKNILAKSTLSRSDVEGLLKKAADLIRTRVDYKFILILLFLKRISDKWEMEYQDAYKEAIKDGLSPKDAEKEAKSGAYHDFDLPEEFLWDNLRKDVSKLPENLSKALKVLAERNPDLKDILADVDFIQFTSNRENAEILRQLIELFSERKLHHVSPDILGDAYEWILRYFAPTKAKEGEVYTPREVIQLLVEMLDPKPEESVYDPACGSAGMLIESYNHVARKYGPEQAKKLFLYGQEYNPKTLALAKMNMFIHDIRDCHILQGDTLRYPKFKEGDGLKLFDVVIANPPWNQDGYDEDSLKKGEFYKQRFSFGYPPRQSADWAWIQHMLASAKEHSGRVGIVVDTGALSRGGKEGAIRQRIIENDLIECVILLPEKLFYNTGAPGVVIVLRKEKSIEYKGKILFINASKEFEQHPDVRKQNRLNEMNINKISKFYKTFNAEKGFSEIVTITEAKKNDYNLSVSLYIVNEQKSEEVDIQKEWLELKKIEEEMTFVDSKIELFLKTLGWGDK